MTTVRTRFAPSPTGYMHIGGMRTALFNWLFAKRHGGVFVLRIDDTDARRNNEEALAPILDAFRWLGLQWDEGPEVGGDFGPYYQSARRPIHDSALTELLDSGAAYRDFEDPAETQRQREAAEKSKQVYVSSRQSAGLSRAESDERAESGESFVVRFMVPRERTVAIDDAVRGRVEWDCGLMVDPVIARADGSPLYNFATAVDDGSLQISHVIRAEEHLSNTPVQVLLHEALGNPLPVFAHLPFVAAPGGKKKLSKRDISRYRSGPAFRRLFELGDEVLGHLQRDSGDDALSPVMVAFYRETGFLPAGVLNSLVRTGWSLDDETEFLSLEEMLQHFDLSRVVRGSAALDPDKLMSYQAHWMAQLSPEERSAGCVRMLQQAGYLSETPQDADLQLVADVVELAGDRLRVFGDIFSYGEFFRPYEELTFDEKNFRKRVTSSPESQQRLRALSALLEDSTDFTAEALKQLLHEFTESQQVRFGDVFPALRLSVTGKAQGADLFRTLALLGRDKVSANLQASLRRAGTQSQGSD